MYLTISRPSFAAKGVHNRPLQDVPLWHGNCFELMATETLRALEKLVLLP